MPLSCARGGFGLPRDNGEENRGGRKGPKGPKEIRGGPSNRQGPSDATLQGSAWANSSPWPVEEGRWSDQKLGNAHVQGFEKHWRSPGGPLPAYPSPGLHTKHAALLGTQSPKFWLPPGHGAIAGTAGSACSVQCAVCGQFRVTLVLLTPRKVHPAGSESGLTRSFRLGPRYFPSTCPCGRCAQPLLTSSAASTSPCH